MTLSEIAKELGRRGGLKRARSLSGQRRREIARLGAAARQESLRLARSMQINFEYVMAMQQLNPRKAAASRSSCAGRLPGIYAKKSKS